ncbi:MAG TPA: prolyl oligopeptidase family serine peptidase [Acidobacteriota bacterium]|nr:prolyl oligopeptidase family serine peptidase [Acidobacteriota bacterium]
MKRLSCIAAICLCLVLGAQSEAPAQTVGKKESAKRDLLAPVRAIREQIRARLARPAELLDLDLIMEGPGFYGAQPRRVRWDSDGNRLWFEWKKWDEEETGTFEYIVTDGSLRRLSEDEAELVPPAFAAWDKEHRRALWTVRRDVMLYDGKTKTAAPLLGAFGGVQPLGFSEDGTEALLLMNNNLVAVSINAEEGTPVIRQLTDIRSGRPGKDETATEAQEWLKEQQLELFDFLERRHERLERDKKREESLSPEPFFLGDWRVDRIVPSPGLNYVAVQQRLNDQKARRAIVANYVTESGYTEDIPARTKVGDTTGGRRLHIIRLSDGAAAEVEFGIEDREIMVFSGEWSPGGERLLVGVRAADNKDNWLFAVQPSLKGGEGEEGGGSLKLDLTELASDHDDAWVGGMRWGAGSGWLPDGSTAWFVSERKGKMHLYTVLADGGEAVPLTKGDDIVSGPRLSPDKSAFVFSATIPDPFESQTFILPLKGGDPRPLTSGMGRADATFSPDGGRLAVVASGSNAPWELYVKDTGEPGVGEKVTDSPSPAFKSYRWVEPQIIHFKAEDGTMIPARLYLPQRPHNDRPAVIFVHGAGYMHNVHRWWSSYEREYCFHHLLMERGYTVLDIDYRGSAGYGRDWRTAIYRHMGGKDLSDQVDGARYLVENHRIDPERIGIYGGSYGGFITLMALFTAGDHFAAGAALRPVTDWAAYSHWYTGSILNLPADDPEAYYRSSPIYFAEGLDDPLLICHGVVDTNVHFQGVVRLAQRLIELRKKNWEVAIFPVENHGFREPASWVDEYRRIFDLFEENLKGNK